MIRKLSVPQPGALAIRDEVAFFQAVKAALVKSTTMRERPAEELDFAIRQLPKPPKSSPW